MKSEKKYEIFLFFDEKGKATTFSTMTCYLILIPLTPWNKLYYINVANQSNTIQLNPNVVLLNILDKRSPWK